MGHALLLAGWIACQSLDMTTTGIALHRGLVEANPIMGQKPARIYSIKVGVNIGAFIWRQKVIPKDKRWIADTGFAIAGCVPGVWNLTQIRKAGRR